MEKIKRGKERLSIKRLKPKSDQEPEITGGYIFKKDRVNPGEKGFVSSQGIQFAFEEPMERKITPAQAQWLTNFVNQFEQVLFSRKFAHPTDGYVKYIDMDSFVDYHWIIEVSRNVDAHWFSQFFHKDRGGKLRAGPVWDWDIGWGNTGYLHGDRTNGWRWQQVKGSYYTWYDRLFEDDDFLQRYIDRWAELRPTVFATSNILARIDKLAAEVEPAAIRNHQFWYVDRKRMATNQDAAGLFHNEVNRMKRWVEGRLAWIDGQEFRPPAIVVEKVAAGILPASAGGFQPRGEEPPTTQMGVEQTTGQDARPTGRQDARHHELLSVRMACPVGKIYYTTNGTDPRLHGGAVSSDAVEYHGPILLGPTNRLIARVRSEYNLWSAPRKVEN